MEMETIIPFVRLRAAKIQALGEADMTDASVEDVAAMVKELAQGMEAIMVGMMSLLVQTPVAQRTARRVSPIIIPPR